jgi:hypothetical protein
MLRHNELHPAFIVPNSRIEKSNESTGAVFFSLPDWYPDSTAPEADKTGLPELEKKLAALLRLPAAGLSAAA